MTRLRYDKLLTAIGAVSLVMSSCAAGGPPRPSFQNIAYADWSEGEPDYRLYPGDTMEIATPSAPELNRTVTVQPDGRIALPLIAPVMVADRSVADAQAAISGAYAAVLRHPAVEVAVKTPSPIKIFVGGEVDKPGVFDMPGDVNVLQAVVMAGGFKPTATQSKVIVIRRGADGRPMVRTVNLARFIQDPARTDAVPVRRFDVIIVPRSGISQLGLFVQQYLRDTLPLSFSYAINGTYATTK